MNNYNFYIGTTRFNTFTFEENKKWREKHKHSGCIYPTNKTIGESIRLNSLVFVLEMNNDINKIMGIGLIRNRRDMNQHIRVYNSDLNYNRYIYHSKRRIDWRDIKNKKMLEVLEYQVFKGADHFKRGQGITRLPWTRFKNKKTRNYISNFLKSLFNLKESL